MQNGTVLRGYMRPTVTICPIYNSQMKFQLCFRPLARDIGVSVAARV